MHILQTMYAVIRHALIKLHYARNICHTYKSYPEKIITETIIVKKKKKKVNKNETANEIPCKCTTRRAGIICACINSDNISLQRDCRSIQY